MHRFLTAFLCLSTLVMTQNVVAGTPSPLDSLEARVIAAGESATRPDGMALAPDRVGGNVPSPASLMLFVTGLAGLSAVGSRGRAEKSASRP